MKKLCGFALFILCAIGVNAQTAFNKLHGYYATKAGDMLQVNDGYIITGNSRQLHNDIFLYKIDFDGSVVWKKTISHLPFLDCEHCVFYIPETSALASVNGSDFFLVGTASDVSRKGIAIKFNANGDTLWTKTMDAGLNTITTTTDSNLIIGGYSMDTAYAPTLWKVDTSWQVLWRNSYYLVTPTGGYRVGSIHEIESSPDSSYVFCGITEDSTGSASYVTKINEDGSVRWKKVITTNSDVLIKLCVLENSDIYVVNPQPGIALDRIDHLFRLNANGNTTWIKSLGDSARVYTISDMRESPEGDLMAIGYVIFFDLSTPTQFLSLYSHPCWVEKVDSAGNLYGGRPYYFDSVRPACACHSITPSNEHGYVLAGTYRYDLWVMEMDSSGNFFNPLTAGCPNSECDTACFIGCDSVSSVDPAMQQFTQVNYNPATRSIMVSLADAPGADFILYTIEGKVVLKKTVASSDLIDTKSLPNGCYFYAVYLKNGAFTKGKLTVLH